MTAYTQRERVVAIVALAVPIAWQLVAVFLAIWKAPVFAKLLIGLGTELPLTTRAFFFARPFLWLVPLAFAGLSFDVLRRRDAPPLYFTVVFVGATVVALVLQAWMVQAMYAPMYQILERIG